MILIYEFLWKVTKLEYFGNKFVNVAIKKVRKEGKMKKESEGLKQGLKDLKEGRTISFKTTMEKFKEEDRWEKSHPVLAKFKYVWWWIRYGIKNKLTGLPMSIRVFAQRGKRGWAVRDVWAFDYYLSRVISEGITHLKAKSHSFPLRVNNKPEEQALKEWNDILDNIIYTFKTAMEIIDGGLHYIHSKDFNKEWFRKETQICKEMNKRHPYFHDRPMTLEEIRKFEGGFDLFREHFFNLWD